MPANNYFRPFVSHAAAFDNGYDLGKDISEGTVVAESTEVHHMIMRLRATQIALGKNNAVSQLIKDLMGIEQTLKEFERKHVTV